MDPESVPRRADRLGRPVDRVVEREAGEARVQVGPERLGHLLGRPRGHVRAAFGRDALECYWRRASLPATTTGVAIVRSIVAGSRPIASQ